MNENENFTRQRSFVVTQEEKLSAFKKKKKSVLELDSQIYCRLELAVGNEYW